MRYVVMGAGAIGGVVGGRLFQSGREVTLVARGPHLEAIQRQGLRLESPVSTEVLPVRAVAHPSEIDDWQSDAVVLLAVKSQQTAAALSALVEVAPPGTPVVCLQNGIANERAVLRQFPNVYGVRVVSPTSHLEPGIVQAWSTPVLGLLDIGRYPGGIDQVCESVAADLQAASFAAEPVVDIRRWKHRKLLTNLANAVEAICGAGERSGPLVDRVRAEGEAALAAAGYEAASEEEDRAHQGDNLQPGHIAGRTRGGGSSWQSAQRATGDIETDYLNGEIVLLGRLHQVPTPANDLLQRLAREFVAARLAPGSIPATTILERLEHA